MPSYDWVCHLCKAPNSAGADICQSCGFSAIAGCRDIEAAVTGVKREPTPSRKELENARREEIAALPLWKKPFAYVLRGLQTLGALIFAINLWSLAWDGIAIGLATIAVAEVFHQLLVRGLSDNQTN